jgi:hypothetical protein
MKKILILLSVIFVLSCAPPEGEEHQYCYRNGTCDGSLICLDGRCEYSDCGYGEVEYNGECVSECTGCSYENCSYEINKCNANQSCVNLSWCIADCYTESCVRSCVYSYPYGANDLLDYLECVEADCYYECY